MRPGDFIELAITDLDEAGAGVARADGVEFHVPGLLPGERGRAEITHVSPHHPRAWAELAAREGPDSPHRTGPACPAFGRCGGCAWQHLAYPAQLEHKRERLRRALRAHDVAAEVAPTVAAPSTLGYRNLGKYVVGRAGERLVLGAYAPRSHDVVDTAGCRVVEPAVDRVAAACRRLLASTRLPIYDERRRRGQLRYVVVRTGADGRCLVTLVTTSDTPRAPIESVAADLTADSEVAGVGWLRNDSTGGSIARGALEPLAGAPTTREELSGVTVDLDPRAFAQVNRAQAAHLYRAVARAADAGPDTRAVDLYCGAGGVAFALAARGARVLGVERHPAAIDAARDAATRAGVDDRVRFEVADAGQLGELVDEAPDVLVCDPPRKGLSAAARGAIARLGPATVVYVSCGPESLARDLAVLAKDGYRIERAVPFDLMPGTAQVEAVVVCRLE